MDAYPVAMLAAQERPVLEKWWPPERRNSVIALRDLAEASAKVLNERAQHYLAEYHLCSTMPTSETETVRIIEKRIGKSIELRTPTFETAVNKLMRANFGDKGVDNVRFGPDAGFGQASDGDLRGDIVLDTAERLILFYSRRELKGSPNVLRWLLGREPTSLEQWVDSVAPK